VTPSQNLAESSNDAEASYPEQGFYDKIFPAATADMRVIPYTQIIDAIKCVRGPRDARQES